MAKLAQHMTRIVVIGELDSYDMNKAGNMGKGYLKVGDAKVQFVIFNNEREGALNLHTKATDFSKLYNKGDKVFITGTDARNYSAEKDTYYEGIQVWDYRKAQNEEKDRWVFVYVGDVKKINENETILSFINYKDEEMIFHLSMDKAKGDSYEVGDRIKVKGELFSGFKMDYYGDSEGYVTERIVVEAKLLNTKEQIEEDAKPNEEDNMWN